MELSVLLVEDDTLKLGRIHQVLVASGVPEARIRHALNGTEAYERLRDEQFDLMLLDINLPLRHGESARRGAGMDVLRQVDRDPALRRPRYVVGVTAYDDVIAEFGDEFAEKLWSLIHYQEHVDLWATQLSKKIEYIQAVRDSDNFNDGVTYGLDLAIVCALGGVEFDAIRRLPCSWQPLKFAHDETRYLTGTIAAARPLSVVAAAAPRMGMAASAVLASKLIASFRPRFLAMVGICAGRVNAVGLGDIIVADPTWDWGSGKVDSVDDQPRFRPSPHQLDLDIDAAAALGELASDVELLARIKREARGNKPPTELKAAVGPLASGAAVVANSAVFERLLDQHRGLLGIEMEAYAVAVACKGSGKPRPVSIIVKSVCDFADKDKVDDYQEYAAETSARFLFEAARRIIT